MKEYISVEPVTKEVLDEIKIGSFVKINDWKKPMRVAGVSENYLVMARNLFGKPYYSVMEKKPCRVRHNAMIPGMFHCGTDFWIFGHAGLSNYSFKDIIETEEYLQSFESGISELSHRTAVPILKIAVK